MMMVVLTVTAVTVMMMTRAALDPHGCCRGPLGGAEKRERERWRERSPAARGTAATPPSAARHTVRRPWTTEHVLAYSCSRDSP